MKAQDNSKGWPEGWLGAAAAAVFAAAMARVVGDMGLFGTLMIALFVFLVFGVLLGLFWGGPIAAASGNDHAGHHGGQGHAAAALGATGHGAVARAATASSATTMMAPAPASAAPASAAPVTAKEVAAAPLHAPDQQATATPAAAVTNGGAAQTSAAPAPAAQPVAAAPSVPKPAAAPAPQPSPVMAPQPVAAAMPDGGSKPQGLAAPRGGAADKLQTIEGIGPVLETLCHDLGIYHFDQIAGWGPAETAWMDGNLKGFKGRVTRDKWVRQAALIGEVGVEEFQRRAKTNDY